MTLCSERKRKTRYFFDINIHLNSEVMSHKVKYTTLRTTETKVTAVRLKTILLCFGLFIVSIFVCEALTQTHFV